MTVGRFRQQHGFTLVEVAVAAMVLTIGMLGAAGMLITANKSTNDASARTGATNIARRVAEAARGVPARNLDPATVLTALQAAAPDLADSNTGDADWTVVRRGFTYTITAEECTLDDPSDGTAPASKKDATFCPSSGPVTSDAQPADFQQVTVRVGYQSSASHTGVVKQVTEVPVGSNSSLPNVTKVAMTSPSSCSASCPAITSAATTSAAFTATTSLEPAGFTWLLQGNPMATCPPSSAGCSGSGTSWTFGWTLGTPAKDTNTSSVNYGKCIAGPYAYDGAYDVSARAQDANDLSGATGSLPVVLNRCPPIPVPGFQATGRDKDIGPIDIAWDTSPEGDVVGYRVYKGSSLTSLTPVCPASVASGQVVSIDAVTECTDAAPPSYSKKNAFYYAIAAVDRDPAGALREGALSSVNVNSGNTAPAAPTTLAVSASAGGRKVTWKLPSGSFDSDSGDTIESFRIYRRSGTATGSPAVSDRIDRELLEALCPSAAAGSTCTYTDTAATGSSTYWVTAVDTHLRESAALGPVTG